MNHLTTQLENTVGKHLTNLIFGALPFVVFFAGNAIYEPIADMSGISTQATAQAVLAFVGVAGGLAIWRVLTLFGFAAPQSSDDEMTPEQRKNLWAKEVVDILAANKALLNFYAPEATYTTKVEGNIYVDNFGRQEMVRNAITGIKALDDDGDDETPIAERSIQDRKKLPKAFSLVLATNGETERKIEGFADYIKSALNLYSVVIDRDENPYGSSVTFICHTEKPRDLLFESRFGGEFFYHNPCVSPMLIPLALTSTNQAWSLPLHHTLIAGVTGAGKGSVIQGIIRQLTPFILKEEVVLYGADPKNAELKAFKQSVLFEEVSIDIEDIVGTIATVWQRMKTRQEFTGREVEYSAQIPVIILMIDEFSSVLKEVDKDTKAKLYQILAQGRSDLIYVVAATQNLDKAIIGDIRDNFANKIALRLESPYFIDIALGAGSHAAGARADLIPAASKANGFASSGLAYAKDETGQVSYIRFAYTSTPEMSELVEATRFDDGQPAKPIPSVI